MRYDGGTDALALSDADARIANFNAWFVADRYWRHIDVVHQQFDWDAIPAAGLKQIIKKQVVNPGTADAFPMWEFGARFTKMRVTNMTTSRVWEWEGDLTGPPGYSSMYVDCRDQTPSVKQHGGSLWSGLTISDLWPLVPGVNDILIEGDYVLASSYKPRLRFYPRSRSC